MMTVKRTLKILANLTAIATLACAAMPALAQFGGPPDNRTPRERALIDITGQWVAVINEDWRWRMITPAVGDSASIPTNAAAREVANAWDLQKDIEEGNLCRAFGAPGLIRQPTRIRIDWQDDNTLAMEFDAGRQTRLLHFGNAMAPANNSLQGYSEASWYKQRVSRGVLGGGGAQGGSIHVTTTHLEPGYLRPNGVPYSDQTVMTEYIHTFELPEIEQSWLIFTTVIHDPVYLTQDMIMSTQFKKETSRRGWEPRDCEIMPPRTEPRPTIPGPFG